MKLEKGMIFEKRGRKHLVLEIAQEKLSDKPYVVAKDMLTDEVWCVDLRFLEVDKIWGEL